MQEQVNKQVEVEEIDGSPCTGRVVSDEEALQVFDWFLSGEYLIKNKGDNSRRETESFRRTCLLRSSRKKNFR